MSQIFKNLLRSSTLLILFFIAAPVTAEPIHPYSEPVVMGDQAIDLNAMLDVAFEATPWTLKKENDELYLGNLSYKGFDVQVRISAVDNVLKMTLDSVTETGCGDNCEDLGEKQVLRWIVSLRRNITYQLTLQVRDGLK